MTTRRNGNTYYKNLSLTQKTKEQYQREYGFDGVEFYQLLLKQLSKHGGEKARSRHKSHGLGQEEGCVYDCIAPCDFRPPASYQPTTVPVCSMTKITI